MEAGLRKNCAAVTKEYGFSMCAEPDKNIPIFRKNQ